MGQRAFRRKLVGSKWDSSSSKAKGGQEGVCWNWQRVAGCGAICACLSLPTEMSVWGRCWQIHNAPWCSANSCSCSMNQSAIKCLPHNSSICKLSIWTNILESRGVVLTKSFISCPLHPISLTLTLNILPLFTLLQLHWLPCLFSNTPRPCRPQGLCTGCSSDWNTPVRHFPGWLLDLIHVSVLMWSLERTSLATLSKKNTCPQVLYLHLFFFKKSWWLIVIYLFICLLVISSPPATPYLCLSSVNFWRAGALFVLLNAVSRLEPCLT